jgi:hypothetical protein
MHIVTGTVLYTSQVPALVCNDPTATVADTGIGIATVTMAASFLSDPVVIAQATKGTEAATTNNIAVVDSVTNTTTAGSESLVIVLRYKEDAAGTAATADPADGDGIHFVCIGLRNN